MHGVAAVYFASAEKYSEKITEVCCSNRFVRQWHSCIPVYPCRNRHQQFHGWNVELAHFGFTLVIGYWFFSTAFTKRHLGGVILGLLGAVALLWLSAGDAESAQPWKGSYVLIATVCYAFSVNILRNKHSDINAPTLPGAALLFVGPPCGIYLFSTDFIHRFCVDDTAFINAFFVFLLAFLGTAVSTVIFNHLIRISSALYASSVTYLIPFIAVLWGLYDGETFNILYLLALVIILIGIYLINYKPRKSEI